MKNSIHAHLQINILDTSKAQKLLSEENMIRTVRKGSYPVN